MPDFTRPAASSAEIVSGIRPPHPEDSRALFVEDYSEYRIRWAAGNRIVACARHRKLNTLAAAPESHMKCPILVLLLLLLQPFVPAQSYKPQAPQSDQQKIRSLEDRWLHAIETSDLAALDSILAADFVRPAPSAGAFVSKSQLLHYFKSRKTPPASRHIETLNVTIY